MVGPRHDLIEASSGVNKKYRCNLFLYIGFGEPIGFSPQIFASRVTEDVVNHGGEVVAAVLLPGEVPEPLGIYSGVS